MTEQTFMGPLPAAAGCTCVICLPPAAHEVDDEDRAVIDTVLRAGWQVMLIGADEEGPSFAYTIGLEHRAGHPEIGMTGQSAALMHQALNYVAAKVVAGHTLRPGDTIEGALVAAPVVVDEVSDVGLEDIGRWSSWFHRRPARAYQLVWPTVSGVFAWQPGAPAAELDERQPPSWRVPSERTGALAADPEWPFAAHPDDFARVCVHLTRELGAPVRVASRSADPPDASQEWTFHCGRDHGTDDWELHHLAHVVRAAPSVRELATLGAGRSATRVDAFSPWQG